MYCEKFGCKTKLEEGAKFCPKCGTPVKMPNLLVAMTYAPSGFTFIFAIVGLFNKDKFVKFHSLQSLVYWIFWIIFLYPFVWIVEVTVSLGSIASGILIGSYILLMFFILPIVYAIKAYKGQVFYIPFFGKLLANLFNEKTMQKK
ncbi:MAG TPA: zinc-ribbon domain-containing protein [Patescibacteria group bacterium]|nr:zinc-ribbon domain-containing protein [Patescibacteria group bacterium]